MLLHGIWQPGQNANQNQVHDRNQQPNLEPFHVLGDDNRPLLRQFGDPDGWQHWGPFQSDDELVNEGWHHDADGLWKHDLAHGGQVGEATGSGGFHLALWYGVDPAANERSRVGAVFQRDCSDPGDEQRNLLPGQVGNPDVDEEGQHHDGDTSKDEA